MSNLASMTGWIALFSFTAMLATCVCSSGCNRYVLRPIKAGNIAAALHGAHKWFVRIAVIMVFVHVALAG